MMQYDAFVNNVMECVVYENYLKTYIKLPFRVALMG